MHFDADPDGFMTLKVKGILGIVDHDASDFTLCVGNHEGPMLDVWERVKSEVDNEFKNKSVRLGVNHRTDEKVFNCRTSVRDVLRIFNIKLLPEFAA